MFIINFHFGKAYPFVEMPLYELTDSVVDGELVLTNEILDLREKLLEIPTVFRKFQEVEAYLFSKFSKRLIPNPFVDFAVNQILKQPSQQSIEDISKKVGYSQKHLIHLFKSNVGLTPKGFLKIIRFQKAIQDIPRIKVLGWSHLALEAGFYDQAHFIHEFKHFSGFTPDAYLRRTGEYLNYIPVD
jgi:AraC-like DNA-binding protein